MNPRSNKTQNNPNNHTDNNFADGLFVPILSGCVFGVLIGLNLLDPFSDALLGVLKAFVKSRVVGWR